MEPVKVAVIYYSATGNVHALAQAAAEGAEKAGAHVRLRKVAETAPPEAVGSRPEWAAHVRNTADVAEAGHDDLEWADAVLFGTPTRFGNPAGQLRAFIETTGPLWYHGKLADKVYSAFTASNTAHGGQESTLLALSNTFYHWGGIIVPPATPTPSSSSRAIPTAPPTWPAAEPPARRPWRRPATRPVASSPSPPRSRPAAPPDLPRLRAGEARYRGGIRPGGTSGRRGRGGGRR
ncbi:NAD(P)H:quinone oxidoreductase [Thermocatellispora tengchongensis]|uniref:NAD(P)H:quinone oxidoreductase n=1 Tax=Thermocatellispora tengchongensis TaxID=1073253 RepID=UPI00362A8CB5